MKRPIRTLIGAAAAIGVLAGAVVAFAVPDRETTPAVDAPTVKLPPVEPVSVAPKAREARWDVTWQIPPGSARIEAQAPDPRGGPVWALRTYDATRYVTRPGPDLNVGHYRCAQVGRLHRGQFGWLNAKGVFRPIGLLKEIWQGCRPQGEDRAGKPFLQFTALIADPGQGASEVYQTVVWGLVGRGTESATLRLTDTEEQVRFGARGGFLRIASGDLHENQASLQVRGPGGEIKRTRPGWLADSPLAGLPGNLLKRIKGRPVGPSHVEVRSADPGGGLPWGVTAMRSSDGGWCLSQAGRIIGDRVGNVQPQTGTMTESFPTVDNCTPGMRPSPSRSMPVNIGWAYMRDYGVLSRAGRAARRTQRERTVFSGTTHPDVKYLTIATPRDVRTLEPSPQAHAFVVAYDDTFPTGDIVLTSTFADGSTRVQRINAAPF